MAETCRVTESTDRLDDLPLLDVADLDAGPEAVDRFREELRTATHEVGFFHLRHRIPAEVTDELFASARRFFALPDADKTAIEMKRSPWFRGYTRVGGELTQGAVDWREQIDVGSEREPGPTTGPAYLRLDGPNQWPQALPELRPVIEAWTDRLSSLGLDSSPSGLSRSARRPRSSTPRSRTPPRS